MVLYQTINLSRYSNEGIYGLFPGVIVKAWVYGSKDFALLLKIFLSILCNVDEDWRNVMETYLIRFCGVTKLCHKIECSCNDYESCKKGIHEVWDNVLDQEAIDLHTHIGKDDYTVLDSLISISKEYKLRDPRIIIPYIFPDSSVMMRKKRIPWKIERLLWIANLKQDSNIFYTLPKELIRFICDFYTIFYSEY